MNYLLDIATALLVVILVVLLFLSIPKPSTKTVILLEGSTSWDVFVGGERTVWNLDYSSYDELPVKNQDYGATVEYKGRKYALWRVYSNQIQVSKEITNIEDK